MTPRVHYHEDAVFDLAGSDESAFTIILPRVLFFDARPIKNGGSKFEIKATFVEIATTLGFVPFKLRFGRNYT